MHPSSSGVRTHWKNDLQKDKVEVKTFKLDKNRSLTVYSSFTLEGSPMIFENDFI